ncbi:MAG: cobalt-precorrin-5B (C(1))-methyltransferase CbiD [Prevotella sp.]|uniref:cobalt-precorrin-5B (C(1))-methyltransferase CbiD n=1 Tax=Prevotella sp. TaxID=59823 RepID=UPI002A2825FE|nr:cobalt-precorrin-5B (C(1))-methyltransferase CbiD [Prevotella sp.]MDD7318965.1 cobalt-precorrin-5B (C(1))-methyltransferase CbiD [Prevotellaceae bacterium]MDY4019991.1 cobalt-precorrin-5B (C(1))-methyltransferase CbiD [Prevotella sp.]
MILVFGGTTEGRKAAIALEDAGKTFYYSTRGSEQEIDLVHGVRTTGAMDIDTIGQFCDEKGIALIIDAAHPFAENLHRNIIEAARRKQLPVIRYERQYPPRSDDMVWCEDYNDAVEQMERRGVERLLALTGVQTIGRLKPFWRRHRTWFRILNRDSSVDLALRNGFPREYLTFYDDEPTAATIHTLRPDAIITKESGESGGFEEKVEAARKAGIAVFVVKRPAVDTAQVKFMRVNGPHGLRLKTQEILPDFYELKTGITTGTCATAAAIAAITRRQTVSVRIPDGEDIEVRVTSLGENSATVTKTAGDDPDITNGLDIVATIVFHPLTSPLSHPSSLPPRPSTLNIIGGEGVGRVTLPGLGLPIGSAAINEVPQQMIRLNVLPLLPEGVSATLTITVPEGRETGKRTFNPRIGVVDGISIIGTSGIVKPFSSEAWINSIRKEMSVGLSVTNQNRPLLTPQIVINSGAKSERFMRSLYPELPEQAFIHYGNFIGETIKIARKLGVERLAMGVMIGKAVKLAEGKLDTHSHKTTMNIDFLKQMLAEAEVEKDIEGLNMARQMWSVLTTEEMQRLEKVIIKHCHEHCDPLLPDGNIDIILISENVTK